MVLALSCANALDLGQLLGAMAIADKTAATVSDLKNEVSWVQHITLLLG